MAAAFAKIFACPIQLPIPRLDRRGMEVELQRHGYLPLSELLSDRYMDLIRQVATDIGLPKIETLNDLLDVADTIELRRRKLVDAATAQRHILPAETPRYMRRLNPAERAWLRLSVERFSPYVTRIFDLQSIHGAPQQRWVEVIRRMHPESATHLHRIRRPDVPLLRPSFIPKDVPNRERYASTVPWFPDSPAYSGMWPADMKLAELRFLRKKYGKSHPVLLPYTIVERLRVEDARRISRGGWLQNRRGEPMEWIATGLGGKRYRVVNMAYHEAYRSSFLALARELRQSAAVTVRGTTLHPTFGRYLRQVASAMERGDFAGWLKADMEQREGNLFFTFFPHEGYWDDNLKFPFTYETGIRDRKAVEYVKKNAGILRLLEEDAARIAKRLGMTIRNTPFDPSTIGDMVQFVWLYQKGAYMYGFPDGEVGGHDYPKMEYAGVSGHRNVIMMDSISAVVKGDRVIIEKLLQAHVARAITAEAAIRFALWHEARHGIVGNRPDTVMRDGRQMGEVFGWLWGAIAEPGSDFGSFRTALLQYEHGIITEEEMEAMLYFGIFRAVKQLPAKEAALTKAFMKVGHPGGRTLYVGYTFLRTRDGRKATLSFDAHDKLVIDFEELTAAANELDERFVGLGLAGSPKAFLEFYRACIGAIPDSFLAKAHGVVGPLNNMPLVDRPGDAMVRLV